MIRIRHRYKEEAAGITTHGAQERLTEVGRKVLEDRERSRFHC